MRRLVSVAVVAALSAAVPLAKAAPAVAADPPTMDHCWWWPGDSAARWDGYYLYKYYGSSSVVKVEFRWKNGLDNHTAVYSFSGNTATATTPIGATDADAELFLGNGRSVYTNTVSCLFR